MGIFDIIELKQHIRSVGEYVLYLDSHPNEIGSCTNFIRDHLKSMYNVLEKLEKKD